MVRVMQPLACRQTCSTQVQNFNATVRTISMQGRLKRPCNLQVPTMTPVVKCDVLQIVKSNQEQQACQQGQI